VGQKRSEGRAATKRKMLPLVENRMLVVQTIDTASADEMIMLKWSLEKCARVCGLDVTNLK
jgi:hypothetical protein